MNEASASAEDFLQGLINAVCKLPGCPALIIGLLADLNLRISIVEAKLCIVLETIYILVNMLSIDNCIHIVICVGIIQQYHAILSDIDIRTLSGPNLIWSAVGEVRWQARHCWIGIRWTHWNLGIVQSYQRESKFPVAQGMNDTELLNTLNLVCIRLSYSFSVRSLICLRDVCFVLYCDIENPSSSAKNSEAWRVKRFPNWWKDINQQIMFAVGL